MDTSSPTDPNIAQREEQLVLKELAFELKQQQSTFEFDLKCREQALNNKIQSFELTMQRREDDFQRRVQMEMEKIKMLAQSTSSSSLLLPDIATTIPDLISPSTTHSSTLYDIGQSCEITNTTQDNNNNGIFRTGDTKSNQTTPTPNTTPTTTFTDNDNSTTPIKLPDIQTLQQLQRDRYQTKVANLQTIVKKVQDRYDDALRLEAVVDKEQRGLKQAREQFESDLEMMGNVQIELQSQFDQLDLDRSRFQSHMDQYAWTGFDQNKLGRDGGRGEKDQKEGGDDQQQKLPSNDGGIDNNTPNHSFANWIHASRPKLQLIQLLNLRTNNDVLEILGMTDDEFEKVYFMERVDLCFYFQLGPLACKYLLTMPRHEFLSSDYPDQIILAFIVKGEESKVVEPRLMDCILGPSSPKTTTTTTTTNPTSYSSTPTPSLKAQSLLFIPRPDELSDSTIARRAVEYKSLHKEFVASIRHKISLDGLLPITFPRIIPRYLRQTVPTLQKINYDDEIKWNPPPSFNPQPQTTKPLVSILKKTQQPPALTPLTTTNHLNGFSLFPPQPSTPPHLQTSTPPFPSRPLPNFYATYASHHKTRAITATNALNPLTSSGPFNPQTPPTGTRTGSTPTTTNHHSGFTATKLHPLATTPSPNPPSLPRRPRPPPSPSSSPPAQPQLAPAMSGLTLTSPYRPSNNINNITHNNNSSGNNITNNNTNNIIPNPQTPLARPPAIPKTLSRSRVALSMDGTNSSDDFFDFGAGSDTD